MEMQSAVCEPISQGNQIASAPSLGPLVDVAGCVRRAVEKNGKHATAAKDAGYEPDYWAKVLTGDRGILLGRLGQLDKAVQIEIVRLWAAKLGLQVERADAKLKKLALAKFIEASTALAECL